MSRPTKREAVEAALRADPGQRSEVIALAVGCSVKWVSRVRTLLYAEGAIPKRHGARTAALRADPELTSERPSVLARRHGLPLPYTSRVQNAVIRDKEPTNG